MESPRLLVRALALAAAFAAGGCSAIQLDFEPRVAGDAGLDGSVEGGEGFGDADDGGDVAPPDDGGCPDECPLDGDLDAWDSSPFDDVYDGGDPDAYDTGTDGPHE